MKPKIGIALGGGGAKGFSHIGVLRALEALSIKPDIIAGTSMGAVVGGLYAADKLTEIEEWALSLNIPDMVKYMDFKLVGGLLKGNKIVERLEQDVEDIKIDQLNKPFGAVVTNLDKGSEVWLRAGSLTQAIRASISIPGVFTPVSMEGYWMADGGLINPVPISLCRAMGADYIIAVTLSEDDCNQELIEESDADTEKDVAVDNTELRKRDHAKLILNDLKSKVKWPKSSLPSMMNLTMRSISIMTNTIAKHRLTVEPTDFLLAPKVGGINMLDFRHAARGIELGYEAVEESEEALLASLDTFHKNFSKQ